MAQFAYLTNQRFPLVSTDYVGPSERSENLSTPPHWQLTYGRSGQYVADHTPHTPFSTYLNPFAAHNSGWPIDPIASNQNSYRPGDLHAPSSRTFLTPTNFCEPPQRPISQPHTPSDLPSYSFENDPPRSLTQSPSQSSEQWQNSLYTINDSSHSPNISPPPARSVKVEPDESDGCFIMELSAPQTQSSNLSQSLAPPTEVPLRATQASKEMRTMMGVFRLNPFAMHSGEGRGVVPSTWCGGEARPLDEEPLLYEFQLNVEGVSDSEDGEASQSFSPDFELQECRADTEPSDWGETRSEPRFTPAPQNWELEYTPRDHYPLPDSMSHEIHSQHSSRIHHTVSHPYLRKSQYHNDLHFSAGLQGPSTSTVDVNRLRPSQTSWTRGVYDPPSRSSPYGSDSPGCDPKVLPSVTSSGRRWSLPDSNLAAPFLM